MEKNKSNVSNKLNGLNIVVIGIISFLYILMITKLAEIISYQYVGDDANVDIIIDDKEQIGTYVMIIYFVSIIGIIAGYVWLSNNKSSFATPNWIVRWSLSIGGVLMLIYTIINYWEYLNDYSKLFLIFLSITSIVYYLYKYY